MVSPSPFPAISDLEHDTFIFIMSYQFCDSHGTVEYVPQKRPGKCSHVQHYYCNSRLRFASNHSVAGHNCNGTVEYAKVPYVGLGMTSSSRP